MVMNKTRAVATIIQAVSPESSVGVSAMAGAARQAVVRTKARANV